MSTAMVTPPLSHQQTWELIPWVVNDSASPAERAQVEEHLRTCADCRDEHAFQIRLQAGMNAQSEPERDPRPAFARLLARIDADSAEVGVAPLATRPAARQATSRRHLRL